MTLVSLLSCSGGPGVTTISLATAAALTGTDVPEPVVVELATSGGVVGSQYDLPTEPGLTSLALAAGDPDADLLAHAQELPGGLPVVLAPPSGSKTTKLVNARADPLAAYLESVPATVVADCGRVAADTPLRPILEASSLVGVVVAASRESFRLAATTVTELNDAAQYRIPVGWVVVGRCPWSHDEITGQYGLPVLCMVPDDRTGAEAVAGLRRLSRRSPLARSCQSFADDIAKHLRISSSAAPLGYLDGEEPAGPPPGELSPIPPDDEPVDPVERGARAR